MLMKTNMTNKQVLIWTKTTRAEKAESNRQTCKEYRTLHSEACQTKTMKL